MSRSEPEFEPLLKKLRNHLLDHGYGTGARFNYPHVARPFLRYLATRKQTIESVTAADVARYLDSLKLKRYRRPFPDHSRRMHRASIHMLLRLVQGQWPHPVPPTSAHQRATHAMVTAFETWMTELRGLSPETRRGRRATMYELLQWLHEQNKSLAALTIDELDVYMAKRYAALRRNSKAEAASNLRTVLRYLNEHGYLARDLAPLVRGPTMYALEGIPPGPDTLNLACSPQHDAPQPDRSIAKMISKVRSLANGKYLPKRARNGASIRIATHSARPRREMTPGSRYHTTFPLPREDVAQVHLLPLVLLRSQGHCLPVAPRGSGAMPNPGGSYDGFRIVPLRLAIHGYGGGCWISQDLAPHAREAARHRRRSAIS